MMMFGDGDQVYVIPSIKNQHSTSNVDQWPPPTSVSSHLSASHHLHHHHCTSVNSLTLLKERDSGLEDQYVGIVTGWRNWWVNAGVCLGLGYRLGFINPIKTHTPSADQGYLRRQKYALYFAVERQFYNELIVDQSAKCNSIHDIHFFGLNLFFSRY